jgi:iron-sulfur cluster insertion protein
MNTVTEPLDFTIDAAKKVWSLMEEEGNLNLKLRVYVEGGGCSGFQYGFTFDEIVNDDDTVVHKIVHRDNADDVTVSLLVDPMSLQYLAGAEIDYKDDIEGERFIIRNPNASTTCGCGSSFAIKEEE